MATHTGNSWLVVPVQTVDATPSNLLIRQYFHFENRNCPAVLDQTPSQEGVPLNQGWPTTFSLLRPLQVNFGLVLHRPIESTALIGKVKLPNAWSVESTSDSSDGHLSTISGVAIVLT
jgi:hypothetical protein